MLDNEAEGFADGILDPALGIESGPLSGRRVCALFVAPKTDTLPYRGRGAFECVVHWSPYDPIPNQGIFRPDSLKYWRQWGTVYPVRASHSRGDFLELGKPVISRKLGNAGGRGGKRKNVWVETNVIALNPINTINGWLGDPDVLVIVGHSQGVNIGMSILNRGM